MFDMDVHVRELRQVFNAIDQSPFHERDLDPAAEEFIVSWASEAPHGAPLRLVIHADSAPASDETDAVVKSAVPASVHHAARRTLHPSDRRGRPDGPAGQRARDKRTLKVRWPSRLQPSNLPMPQQLEQRAHAR